MKTFLEEEKKLFECEVGPKSPDRNIFNFFFLKKKKKYFECGKCGISKKIFWEKTFVEDNSFQKNVGFLKKFFLKKKKKKKKIVNFLCWREPLDPALASWADYRPGVSL